MRAYSGQPYLFRNGANDGFHEAIGDAIALSITPEYLKTIGLIDTVPPPEADIPLLLRTALEDVAFLPFGLMIDKWRWQVFSGETKPSDYNRAWWALREQYQGVAPPVARTEADFDPGAKFHIPANTPYARYYLADIYKFQFFKAMCEAAGYRGPLNRCSFYGSKAAGAKLQKMMAAGQSQPWQVTLQEMTGTSQLDAGPLLEYFEPLREWLQRQNAAARVTPGGVSETTRATTRKRDVEDGGTPLSSGASRRDGCGESKKTVRSPSQGTHFLRTRRIAPSSAYNRPS